jgi:hypothetical protein
VTRSMTQRRTGWVAAGTALAWLGFYIHNVADLPGQTLLSPETSLPTLVTLVLFLVWWRFPFKRVTTWLLLGWGVLNLIGGGISVFPFAFLPFYPEQTVRHYFFHVVYGAAQLPLIGLMLADIRQFASR